MVEGRNSVYLKGFPCIFLRENMKVYECCGPTMNQVFRLDSSQPDYHRGSKFLEYFFSADESY